MCMFAYVHVYLCIYMYVDVDVCVYTVYKMYIAILLSILTLLPFVHSIVNMFFFSDNVNLAFSHLHSPPRTVYLIRQCVPLLPFPSQSYITCLLPLCLSPMDMSSVILFILHILFIGMSIFSLEI